MNHPDRRLTERAVRDLVLDTEPWLSCEDCFTLMDVYVEELLADARTSALPGMRAHLTGCPACAEEAQSLLDLVAADRSEPEAGDAPTT